MSALQPACEQLLVPRCEARQAQHDALRLFIGRSRRFSIKQVGNATGVPDRMIAAAMCEPDSPEYRPLNFEQLLSISKFLGKGFTSEWLALAGQGSFELPEAEVIPLGALVADSADSTADLAGFAADGRICANDRTEMVEVGHRDIARGVRLLVMAGGRAKTRLHDFFASHSWPLRKVG